ncbi:hypothetical protein TNCV_2764571 [Trichonephila clavipes]|nr:hypothetical protein TNCV_2764571 [Trichonephila clavipes]
MDIVRVDIGLSFSKRDAADCEDAVVTIDGSCSAVTYFHKEEVYGRKITLYTSWAQQHAAVASQPSFILIIHPETHLVPTFGSFAPASSDSEGGGNATEYYFSTPLNLQVQSLEVSLRSSGIIRKVTRISNIRFQILVHYPENDKRSTFPASRILRKVPVTVRVIDSRPELTGKSATISHIGYQIQIARLKIRQELSFHLPRLLKGCGSPVVKNMYASSSSVNPTLLAHADDQRDVHPGGYHRVASSGVFHVT